MSEREDPERWLQARGEAAMPDELRGLVEAEGAAPSGAQQAVDAARLARVMQGVATEVGRPELLQALGAAGTGSEAGAATQPVAPGGGVGTAVLKVVLGGLLVGSVAWLAVPRAQPRVEDAAPVEAALPAAVAPPAPTPPRAPAAQPAPAVEAQHAAPEPEPSGPRKVRRAGRPGLEPERVDGPSDPVQELSLLEQAQRSLRDDPRDALARADSHRRRYPKGQFVQEREMIAIEALVKLELTDRARRRGRRFMRRFPSSSHVPRLRELLADTPTR